MPESRETFDAMLATFEVEATCAFTPRERDVIFERVVRGRGNTDTARALGVSVQTVERHVARAALKLGYARGTDAIRELFRDYARRESDGWERQQGGKARVGFPT